MDSCFHRNDGVGEFVLDNCLLFDQGHRVDMVAVLGDFEGEFMVNTSDGRPFFNLFTFSNIRCNLVQVGVNGVKTIAVLYDDNIV